MAVGESAVLSDPAQVAAFELVGAAEERHYEVAVQSGSETFGGSTAMQLSLQASGATASAVDRGGLGTRPGFSSLPDHIARRLNALELEDRLRRAAREELRRVGARPIRARSGGPGPRLSVASSPPTVGESVEFNLAVTPQLTVNCDSQKKIDAVYRFVGQHYAIAEDVQNAGHLTPADYQSLGQTFDDVIYPTLTAYFGEPADIDGNGVAVALITAEVNKLTPRNSGTLIAGFFFSGDLVSPSTCPATNEAELLYVVAPDPNGDFSDPISIGTAISLARTTGAHEFMHLLNTQQRVTIGGGSLLDREVAWLDEGLAHLAEEVTGLGVVGLPTRANLDLDGLSPEGDQVAQDAFNDFHLLNLIRAARFLLEPEETPALGDANGDDPADVSTLLMRGYGYMFTRWLGDHFGPPGAGVIPGSREEALFRELSSGGPTFLTGTSNVERAVQVIAGQSVEWRDLVADFLGMVVVDDTGLPGLDPRLTSLSFDYRALFLQLSEADFVDSNGNPAPPPTALQNEYPLMPTRLPLGETTNTTRSFTVEASAGAFFTIEGGPTTPDAVVRLTTSAGAPLPGSAAAQVTVVRVR